MWVVGRTSMKKHKSRGAPAFLAACVTTFLWSSCESKIEVEVVQGNKSASVISGLKPIAAKPGELVSVSGTGFNTKQKTFVKITSAQAEAVSVPLDVLSSSQASFLMPEGVGIGLASIALESNGRQSTEPVRFVADLPTNTLPILLTEQDQICSDIQFVDGGGVTKFGTKNCYGNSIDLTNLVATNIRAGITINGISGSYAAAPADCAADGAVNCTTVGSYPAAQASGAADKILSGQTVGGVPGNVTLPAVGKVYAGVSFGINGTNRTGTLTIPVASNVLAGSATYGDPGAPVSPSLTNHGTWNLTTSFPGAGYYSGVSNAPADTVIASGSSIAGVTGTATLESHGNCTSDGATGCVTTASFKSAAMANATAGNIKSGVTIAGVTGQYPNATYTLPSASGVDLTAATFNAQIKSSATFQYYDSAGNRHTGSGDADIIDSNIVTGFEIFGATGTYAGVAPNAWDVRSGSVVNGVTGKLKINCRNRATSSIYNYDGLLSSIPNARVTFGTNIDHWDTIDDNNNSSPGQPSSVVSSWENNSCGGIESTLGDDNVWRDVTTSNGISSSNCASSPGNCTMQDKITGLWWSSFQISAPWITALTTCGDTLNNVTFFPNSAVGHNGQTGWRLPTQKELMEAYDHGIRSAASSNWITEAAMNGNFWSATAGSEASFYAWYVNLANGMNNAFRRIDSYGIVCVRP